MQSILQKNIKKGAQKIKMLQGDKSVQIRTDNIKSNSFVNDFELIKKSLEYYSNL